MPVLPPAEVQAIVEAGIAARGWIINTYAQFENLLSDLVRRAKSLPEYAHFDVPYRTATRITRVRELLALDGQLSQFQATIGSLIDRFETFEDERLMMVHSYTIVHFDANLDVTFTFEFYRPLNADQVELKRVVCGLAELETWSADYKAFGNEALGRFRELHEAMGWA
jgi:hypothetical protein